MKNTKAEKGYRVADPRGFSDAARAKKTRGGFARG